MIPNANLKDLKIALAVYDVDTSGNSLVWSSGNTGVATVNQVTGRVMAVESGTTMIYATKVIDGQTYQASYTLEVMDANEGFYKIKNNVINDSNLKPTTGVGISTVACKTLNTSLDDNWIIEPTLDGYYRIQLANTNLFLGVESSLDSYICEMVTKSDTEYNIDWNIIELENGGYSFISRITDVGELYLGINNLTDKTAVVYEAPYEEENLYKFQLIESDCEYRFNLDLYYDMGYKVRYETNDGIPIQQKLTSIMNEISQYYSQTLGIEMNINISQYQTEADKCKIENYTNVTSENIDLPCPGHPYLALSGGACELGIDDMISEFVNCTDLSKNISKFKINHPSSVKQSVFLLSGHRYFARNNNGLFQTNATGVYRDHFGIISHLYSADIYYEAMKLELSHKIAHLFGAIDHHASTNCGTLNCNPNCSCCGVAGVMRPTSCVMIGWESDSSRKVCDACLEVMRDRMRECFVESGE